MSLSILLTDADYDKITVVLPHNYPSVDPKSSEIPLDEFLNRERNYAAVILKAECTVTSELLKILFINNNGRAIFADDTFPMAESEPSGIFLQSPDPGRAFAVLEYFHEFLSSESLWPFYFRGIASLVSMLFLVGEGMALVAGQSGLLSSKLSTHAALDVVASIVAAVTVYRFAATPTGLWVKPRRDTKLLYLANMALKGEMRDNPLVQLLVTVVGGLLVAFLAKWLGLLN